MRSLLISTALLLAAPAVSADCLAIDGGRERLVALKALSFEIDAAADRNALAVQLVDCLASPDPLLRDGVAFEALSTWMRADLLDTPTLQTLRAALLERLRMPVDAAGVRRPFAALALAELSRVDRIGARFDADQLGELVDACVDYLHGIRDYRGFEAGVGWRHQVAHAADWVLQLVLNARVDGTAMGRLLDALGAQIAPPEVVYTHGEPERIARAVFYAYQRDVLDADYWDRWFAAHVDPAPFESWQAAAGDEAGLARRHDLFAFFFALHFAATVREGQEDAELRRRALRAIEVLSG